MAAAPSVKYASLSPGQRLLAVLFIVAGVGYLAWRPTRFSPDAPALSALVYAAELFAFAAAMLHLFVCWRLKVRTPLPVPPHASAAVLVPTVDESVDVARRTLTAALCMPHAREVWLLDDGNRLEMQVLAEELGCHYLARAETNDGVAGCLNDALRHTRADYLAIFEVGQTPAPDFLSETLGFFRDGRVAFVQTPLDFYNLDSLPYRFNRRDSRVWGEHTVFFRVIQAGLDRFDAAIFCGSCALIRRTALEDIGGFATGTVTHDLHTSLRLHKRGWRSVYYARSLAFGQAPSSTDAFLGQRGRRALGARQVWRQEDVLRASGLTPARRASYLAILLTGFEAGPRLILYLAPAIVLATGALPMAALDREFLLRFVPYSALALWAVSEVARGYGRRLPSAQYAMLGFAVSVSAASGHLLRRLRRFAKRKSTIEAEPPRPGLWPVYAVLGVNAAAIPTGIVMHGQGSGPPIGAFLASLLWSSCTVGVAALALRFARHTVSFQRREYRFPLPVPLRLQTGKGTELALATDISPAGCRLVGELVGRVCAGDTLSGELLLPTGALPVQASVRTVFADPGRGNAPGAIGCEFRWGLSEERGQLERFLFGSDLQWRLNGLEDRIPTPLERLGDLVRGVRPEARHLRGLRWSPLLLRRINSRQDECVGFISVADGDDGERTVVSLGALPKNGRLYAEELTPAGTRGIVGRVTDEEVLETHAAPIYLYRLCA